MNIIPNLWSRLNILIPEPLCSTRGNDYDSIKWSDKRSKPTATKVKAVSYDIKRIYDKEASKSVRDNALNALVYDLGGGRIIQTRPKDESNIRNAIEIMTANSIASISWVMVDDIKKPVTLSDLKKALSAGQLSALSIWDAYIP